MNNAANFTVDEIEAHAKKWADEAFKPEMAVETIVFDNGKRLEMEKVNDELLINNAEARELALGVVLVDSETDVNNYRKQLREMLKDQLQEMIHDAVSFDHALVEYVL